MKIPQVVVLVIEDEPLLLGLLCELLRDLGAEVVAVDRADAGMTYLEDHAGELGLIVTDVMMPGRLNGHDLAVAVSARWPRLPVLVTSGYTPSKNHEMPYNTFFIAKPWNLQQMEAAVTERLPLLKVS
ncbi:MULTISPECIES: response regulator [unclassified Pseudomonas]|uniref:response regulator n=1 Tax=unclassified Pseudomonas TaxID=196821 RepID=UPI00131C8023|nr:MULTISPECIES: response regulator [unclassified Pseudomonas]